ncbi:hypothetical protein AAIH70_18910 [Neorhizobium sp. BT27B]|uniref:hypothetical protein n=1 Tax=Neorhizobium sp. BT27B TaxID=3142625 RepID=UPI003D2CF2F5
MIHNTVSKIPDALAHQYKESGKALAAFKDDTVVGLVYIRDILPDAEEPAESLLPLWSNPHVGIAARELLKTADHVFAGIVSRWEFTPVIEIEWGTRSPGGIILDPGNEGEPGTVWTQDEADLGWRTTLRVADNSFDIVIADGGPDFNNVPSTCEVLIHRVDGSPPVVIHKSGEKNWMEARRAATVAMRIANAARGA